MTTHLYFGRQPAGYEAEAIAKLRKELDAAGVNAYLFANFEVGGHEIDLLVVTPNGLFLIELKKVNGPITGAVNGEWRVLTGIGEYTLHGGRGENPFQQMRTQYRVLSEFLERRKRDFLSPAKANATRFRSLNYRERQLPKVEIRSLLTFYPKLPPNNLLDIPRWPIVPVSFCDLPAILQRSTRRVNLTNGEIVRIAQALHLTLCTDKTQTPLPSRLELQPTPLWLPPKGFGQRNAWLQSCCV